jgi:hypothetical protein
MYHRAVILVLSVLAVMPVLAGEPAANIQVANPYVRAVPPGQPNSAAFMELTNPGEADRALIAASSAAAETVELHTHTMVDGMMQMRRVERIDLPAGETVTLAPGGLHVMLIGLTVPLAPGDRIALTLTFDEGSEEQVSAPVRAIAAVPMPHQHH